MRRSLCACLAAASIAALAAIGVPASASAPSAIVAESRCNSETINDASEQIRSFDKHAPRGSSGDLQARYGAISQILTLLGEERGILESVCSSDAERAPLFAQIAAAAAWALALEADVTARLNASCPAAAKALPTMLLADAWLSLANVVNDEGGTVPPSIAEVVPKVRSRAAAAGLTLPAWSDTSTYWRDQIRTREQAAAETCATPSP